MRDALGCLIIICCAWVYGEGAAIRVAQDGTGNHTTIQDAIDAAAEGDVIEVAAGQYAEALQVSKGVHLKGAGREAVEVVADSSHAKRGLMSIDSCKKVRIEGIAFRQIGRREASKAVIAMNDCEVEMIDCVVSGSLFRGIEVGPSRNDVVIRGCLVRECSQEGLVVDSSGGRFLIEDCVVEGNGRSGIRVGRMSAGAITSCVMKGNGTAIMVEDTCDVIAETCVLEGNATGIHAQGAATLKVVGSKVTGCLSDAVRLVSDAAADVALEGCTISANRGYGIVSSSGARIMVSSCEIKDNGEYGISLLKTTSGGLFGNTVCGNGKGGSVIYGSAQIDVVSNAFKANAGHGLFVSEQSRGAAEKNVCEGNGKDGIYVSSQTSGWRLSANTCVRNTGNGIGVVGEAVCPTVEGNVCRENGRNGIELRLGARATVNENLCVDNRAYGLSVDVLAFMAGEGNRYEGNLEGQVYVAEGMFGRVRDLLLVRDYGELEKVAKRLRRDDGMTSEGRSIVSVFYSHLGNGWGSPGHEGFEWFCGLIDEWMAKHPDSVTACNLKVYNIYRAAWAARGSGYWAETPVEQRRRYRAELERCWKVVQKGIGLAEQDGELYAHALAIAIEMNQPEEVVEDVFAKGVSIAPGYSKIYSTRSRYLAERWGGKPGELEAFMDRAYELTKELEGASIYARIATFQLAVYGPSEFETHKIGYEKLRNGFLDVLERYPDSKRFTNACCAIAVMHGDKDLARKMFDKMGKEWLREVWKDESRYQEARTWAYGLKAT